MGDWLAQNWTEILGFVTGGVCVLLAARRNIWNFPIGILNNVVFFVVFAGAALYADAGLQVVFLVLAVMGWVGWLRHRGRDDKALVVSTPRRAILPMALATVALTAVIAFALHFYTDSTTEIADAATTAVSLVAQYMLNRRWIENWFVWIAVDVAYVALYLSKGLVITGGLYVLFIAFCVVGYVGWTKARAAQSSTPAFDPATSDRVVAGGTPGA